MKVLVINCGSSSLKYQLIDSETESVLAKGLCERIGIDGALTHQPAGKDKIKSTPAMPDHKTAIGIVIDQLTDKENGVVESLDEIGAVGHRIVHGGEKFTKSCLITDEVIKEVEECSVFAPLHNPAGLIGVRACQELMPGLPMVAVFDTAFHQTMPEKAFLYGIPRKYYDEDGIPRNISSVRIFRDSKSLRKRYQRLKDHRMPFRKRCKCYSSQRWRISRYIYGINTT